MKIKRKIVNERISGRVLPGLPPQKLTAIFGVPSRPVTRPEMYHYTLPIVPTVLIVLILPFLFILGLLTTHNTSALSYQSNTEVQFTINPTINITVSGDLVINNLTPGSNSDSNIIDVNVGTNNVTGYSLLATVGNNTNNSTELRRNGTDTANKFTSLATTDSVESLTTDNTWGYALSTDTGATWSNYSGLPLDTNSNIVNSEDITGKELVNTNDNTTIPIRFKIAAKVSDNQIAGNYTNTINFYAVAKPSPTTFVEAFAAAGKQKYNGYYKMQDMTSSICIAAEQGSNIQLIDIRDNEVYMIAKLKDDNCWMLDNLRLGGSEPITLTNQDTNIVEEFTLRASTSGWHNNYTKPSINADYKDDITTHYGPGSGKVGVYYSYCAASAGTYCVSSGSGDATYDVCPLNWRLPTGNQSTGEYIKLARFYRSSNATNPNSLQYNLSLPLSGYYHAQVYALGERGFWWTSTYVDEYNMYTLFVSDSALYPTGTSDPYVRRKGFSIRCIAQ